MRAEDVAAIQRIQGELAEIEGRLTLELNQVIAQTRSPTAAKRAAPIAIQLGGVTAAQAALETIA